jgi:hypothetical protein
MTQSGHYRIAKQLIEVRGERFSIFGSDYCQSYSPRKVSQLETVPNFKPVMNHRVRWADDP